MADDDDDEIEEEKPKSFLARLFSGRSLERFLVESFRLIIFAVVAFLIASFVLNRNNRNLGTGLSQFQVFSSSSAEEELIITSDMSAEWELDEIIVNTADDLSSHFVKAIVVVSYDKSNEEILGSLASRTGEIQSGIREIIGSKDFLELKKVENQRIIAEEIKVKIQRIVGSSSVLDIFLKEFSVY